MKKHTFYIIYYLLFATIPINAFAQLKTGEQLNFKASGIDTAAINQLIDKGYAVLSSNPDSALVYFQEVIRKSETMGYAKGKIKGLRCLAATYANLGKYDKSMSLYMEALSLAERQIPGSREIEFLYNNMASIYVNFGDLKQAAAYYFKVLELTEKSGNIVGRVQAYNNLSEIYGSMGEYQKGLDCISKGLQIAPQKKLSRDMIPYLYINQAGLLTGAGRYQDAITASNNALKSNNEGMQLELITVEANIGLADVYAKMGMEDEQIQSLSDALAAVNNYPLGKEKTLLRFGGIYSEKKDFKAAKRYFEMALPIAESTKSTGELLGVHSGLADVNLNLGNYKDAAIHFKIASQLKDSLNAAENSRNIDFIEWKYRTAVKDKEIAVKQVQLDKQQQQLSRKNYIIGSVSAGLFAVVLLLFLISRSYRQKRAIDEQKNEINVWKATHDGEEKERRRLARELHDNIGGALTNLKMWLTTIQEKHDVLLSEPEYTGALQLLDNTVMEVRNSAHNLMPELLLRFGLVEAVRAFCHNVEKASGIIISCQYLGLIEKMESSLELLIYRSIQELIQNVVKHSKATTCLLQLSGHDDMLYITIEDNGIGMDKTMLGQTGGMGLQQTEKSINHIGGHFNIETAPGGGTVINIDIEATQLIA
jgi:signal transduction histidine kinase